MNVPRFLFAVVALAICSVFACAEETDTLLETGTLKVSSTPMECVVSFRGNRYEKDRAVMTFDNIPAGQYTVGFSANGKTIQRGVMIRAGETSIMFGNIDSGEEISTPTAVQEAATPVQGGISPNAVPVEEADTLFRLAEIYRDAMNPFLKTNRYREAEAMYKKILEKYPHSDKVEFCHYRLGDIYESMYIRNFNQAIVEYKKVIEYNFDTALDVRFRIAKLYEKSLGDKSLAREWYDLSVKYSRSDDIRSKAAARSEALKKKGF